MMVIYIYLAKVESCINLRTSYYIIKLLKAGQVNIKLPTSLGLVNSDQRSQVKGYQIRLKT